MDPEVKKRFTPKLQTQITHHFGCESYSNLRDLNGFENFVYALKFEGQNRILRIGHSQRRSENQVRSEMEWLRFLADNDVSVASPVGDIALFDDGHGAAFVATLFEEAPGARPVDEDRTPKYYETYGAAIGRLHAVTRRFSPSPGFCRPSWSRETAEVERYLSADDDIILRRIAEVREKIESLPVTVDWYGLIHQDAHEGNLHLDRDGRITLFDFDDCVFGHFVYDLAMVFFYAGFKDDDPAEKTRLYFADFMRGYRSEHELPGECIAAIPFFMKLREIDLYAVVRRSYDSEKLGEMRFMKGRRDRIAEGKAWMDFDFDA